MMNLITLMNNSDNIIKENYCIMPYYEYSSIVYIKIKNDSFQWFDYNFKSIKQLKRINKSLTYFYNNSIFKGYSIIIIGYLNNFNNFRSLGIFDLMLFDQFNRSSFLKKYSIRHENINLRFLTNIPNNIKNVYSLFSKKYSEELFNGMCTNCILANKWEGYSLYPDKLEDKTLHIISEKSWNIYFGLIVKVDLDPKNEKIMNIVVEEEKSQKLYNIYYGLESIKNNDVINQKCKFKMCNINNNSNIIFLNIE